MQVTSQATFPAIDFVNFYETHVALVRAVVRKFRFTHVTVEDLVQDIFIKVWRSLDKLQNQESIAGWLRVIARNHCLNEVKSKKRESRHIVSLESIEDYKVHIEFQYADVINRVEFEEYSEILLYLIANHGEENRREVARLFYVEQKSLRDICLQLNIKQNTALSHLRRFRLIATKTLHKFMEDREAE